MLFLILILLLVDIMPFLLFFTLNFLLGLSKISFLSLALFLGLSGLSFFSLDFILLFWKKLSFSSNSSFFFFSYFFLSYFTIISYFFKIFFFSSNSSSSLITSSLKICGCFPIEINSLILLKSISLLFKLK